jgi:drug/metabolite transporter (DMT)-like permease
MSATFIMEASKLMMTLSFLVVAVGSSANSPASALGELIDQKQYTGGESWRLSWRSSLHSLVQLVCRLRTAVGRVEWADLRLYSIPAIIYLVNDNILYFIYSMLDQAATFEVLSNLKIVATSFLYKFFLDKDISKTQWISLGLLGVGSVRALAVCKLGAPGHLPKKR